MKTLKRRFSGPRMKRGRSWSPTRASSCSRFGRSPAPTAGRPVRSSLKGRSEEHTSELQSRENLVCRLLLEKKKVDRVLERGRQTELEVERHFKYYRSDLEPPSSSHK